MRTHTIKVRGRRASIDDRTLVQGTVGEDVLALDLDEEWDGLVVTVAFKWQHDSSIVAKQVEGGYEVPWECNQQPGKVLIAVEGTKDGKVMVNEINTMPGFTSISMYPKAWEATGVRYTDLITMLIEGVLR